MSPAAKIDTDGFENSGGVEMVGHNAADGLVSELSHIRVDVWIGDGKDKSLVTPKSVTLVTPYSCWVFLTSKILIYLPAIHSKAVNPLTNTMTEWYKNR
jgi:hypothetical protein